MAYEALKKERDVKGDTLSFWHESNPKCPHCGEVYCIQANENWALYNPNIDIEEVTCPHCGVEFTVVVEVTFFYSTDELPDDDEEL